MRVGGKKRKRNSIIASIVIGGTVIIGLILLFLHINKNADYEHEIIFKDTGFQVTGLHGGIYEYSSIKSVKLKNEMPEILSRNKGVAVGTIKKGTFELKDLGLARLYIVSDSGPYIIVEVNDFHVIINEKDSDKTNEIFQEMLKKIENKLIE